jgi:membrane protein required for colicin V production
MNPLDWALVAVVGVSVLLGLLRGFMRELFSLAGWIAGVWLAFLYAQPIAGRVPFAADWPLAKTAAAAVLIVVGCVFAAALAGWLVRELVKAARLSAADRTLGGLFGFARGLLLVGVAVFLVRDTALYREPLWRESRVVPQIEAALAFALRQFPHAAERAPGA